MRRILDSDSGNAMGEGYAGFGGLGGGERAAREGGMDLDCPPKTEPPLGLGFR